MYSSELQELEVSLATARSESSPPQARAILRTVASQCRELFDGGFTDAAIVGASAFSELAALEMLPAERLQYRRAAITLLREATQKSLAARLLASYANRIVDLFHDNVQEERPKINAWLSGAANSLAKGINGNKNPLELAQLLTQRASVLRCQAMVSALSERRARIDEAIRCAQRATSESPHDPFAKLELGQALQQSARWANSDEDCFRTLQKAEEVLLRSQNSDEPLPRLVLARFYRQSYRPAQAIDTFREYETLERANRRRLLAHAHIVGEAAMQVWYGDYESSFVGNALEYAYSLVSESIDAGYEIARNFTGLAFVQAAIGRPEAADLTLRRLSQGDIPSWLEVIDKAEASVRDSNFSSLQQAFALGINDSSIWNSLGTFASRFLQDPFLALRLYSVAKKLEPRNAVVLTNIARIHLHLGSAEDLIIAEEALRIAGTCAARTFVWWRSLLEDLRQRRGIARLALSRELQKRDWNAKLSFADIQSRYWSLRKGVEEACIDPQRRGYTIQDIVRDLLVLTFHSGDVLGSQKIRERQVDASFTYRDVRHLVEVKWKGQALDRSDLDSLRAILDQAEVRGVLISMSGFTDSAVSYAREMGQRHAVILIDGEEMDAVIVARFRFEGLLEWKLSHWRRNGNPYVRRIDGGDGS